LFPCFLHASGTTTKHNSVIGIKIDRQLCIRSFPWAELQS
jgi:hypothetical protein